MALKQILFIISSTGRRFACASITSVAVVHRAPVTAVVAMCWTVVSLRATPVELLDLPEPSLRTGVNPDICHICEARYGHRLIELLHLPGGYASCGPG